MTTRTKRLVRSTRTRTRPYEKKRQASLPVATRGTSTSLVPSAASPTPDPMAPLADQHGFPTHVQFSEMLKRYITSLHPRKSVKALIDREMYDKIHGSLNDPSNHRIGNAQFRFWVRKMFSLEHVPGYTGPYSENADSSSPILVVVHENRPVAIKEELYSVLCHCHGLAQHGGRDRTCAVVRSLYSYVPKVLIAAFVAECPTCQYRRTGDPVYLPYMATQPARQEEQDVVLVEHPAQEDAKTPELTYFGPGPEYPFGGAIPSEQPVSLPPWLHLSLPPLPPLRPTHRGSTSSIDTHTTLMTPDVDNIDALPLRLPPLHLPPIMPASPIHDPLLHWDSAPAEPRVSGWDAMPSFPSFSAPSTLPSSPSKHRLPSVSQLLRMEGVDGESYAYGHGDEENIQLPRLMDALTDEARRANVPIDPSLLGERSHHESPIFSPFPHAFPELSTHATASQLPHIMVTSPVHTHARPPPLDLSRISALHVSPPIFSPLSPSPLSSDRSNLPTGSSVSFDTSLPDGMQGGLSRKTSSVRTKGTRKARGKRRADSEDDQNAECYMFTMASSSTRRPRRTTTRTTRT